MGNTTTTPTGADRSSSDCSARLLHLLRNIEVWNQRASDPERYPEARAIAD